MYDTQSWEGVTGEYVIIARDKNHNEKYPKCTIACECEGPFPNKKALIFV
jgi:hypothetical protein